MDKGWFIVEGVQDGDRTLDEQLLGLDALLAVAKGASVLDLGCAEGLIAREFAIRGATVHGLTIVEAEVFAGKRFCVGLPVTIAQVNLNNPDWPVNESYDIVLALSIAHKLRMPNHFLRRAASIATDLVAVRLPAKIHLDVRTPDIEIDPVKHLAAVGFELIAEPETCRGEWLGVFRRC